MKSIELIEMLSNASGAPGHEDQVVKVIRSQLAPQLTVIEDKMRNLIIRGQEENPDWPTVVLDGHSDEVGFMVQSIQPNGLIKVLPLGGWVATNVMAHRFRIANDEGREIPAVSASKPPHFMTEEEKKKNIGLEDMRLDVGASSADLVRELYKISEGAAVVPDVQMIHDEIQGNLIGKAFDNRLGTAIVIETMNVLKEMDLSVNVVGVISTQEEAGTRGAQVTSQQVEADLAIVLEGSPADDGFRPEWESQGALGKGAQIRFRDRSMIAHPRFSKMIKETAQQEGISHQVAVRKGGGTNAGRYHLSGQGVPSAVLGIPVRYIHTHYGICRIADYQAVRDLVKAVLSRLDKGTVEGF